MAAKPNPPHVIVDALLHNLLDRRGIKWGFENIDNDVLSEMFTTLEGIVAEGLQGTLEDRGCSLRPRCGCCDSFEVGYRCEECDAQVCGSIYCTFSNDKYSVLCQDCYDKIEIEESEQHSHRTDSK